MSWATPILVKSGGRDELVTAGNQAIIGYDPATGRELWRMKGLASNAVPSPVAGDGIVVLSAGYPTKLAMAVRPGGSGDVTETDRVLWKYDKGTAYVPSPILVGGLVYLVTDKGLISCLDAKTGKVHYEGGRPPVGASYMASPVAVGGPPAAVEHGRRHDRAEGRDHPRDRAQQPARRADRRFARDRGGPHLHPRRAPPVRDRDAMRAAALAFALLAPAAAAAATPDDLLAAVRRGELAGVKAALDAGVPVDAPFRYERTALSFAADRGTSRSSACCSTGAPTPTRRIRSTARPR